MTDEQDLLGEPAATAPAASAAAEGDGELKAMHAIVKKSVPRRRCSWYSVEPGAETDQHPKSCKERSSVEFSFQESF
jgi:hypothetical protein